MIKLKKILLESDVDFTKYLQKSSEFYDFIETPDDEDNHSIAYTMPTHINYTAPSEDEQKYNLAPIDWHLLFDILDTAFDDMTSNQTDLQYIRRQEKYFGISLFELSLAVSILSNSSDRKLSKNEFKQLLNSTEKIIWQATSKEKIEFSTLKKRIENILQ